MKQLGCVGRQLGPLYDDPHSCILNRKIYIYSIFNIYSIGIGEDCIVNSIYNNNNNNKNKNSYNNSSFDNFPHWNLTKMDGW